MGVLWVCHRVNKFDQISSDDHQKISSGGGDGYLRSHVWEGVSHGGEYLSTHVRGGGYPTIMIHVMYLPLPWTEWLKDACENITFLKPRLRAVTTCSVLTSINTMLFPVKCPSSLI